jgi:hypothetical protein
MRTHTKKSRKTEQSMNCAGIVLDAVVDEERRLGRTETMMGEEE